MVKRALSSVWVSILLAWVAIGAADAAATWTAGVSQRDGLPFVSAGGAPAVSANFAFWGKNWTWANLDSKFSIVAPFEYLFSGRNKTLNLDLAGRIAKRSSHEMVWEFDFDAQTDLTGVVGGGITFKFDIANFAPLMGEPELLPANQGWTWGRSGTTRVEMRFDPPLAAVYYERGQKNEVRAFFYQGDVPRGQRRQVTTLTLSDNMSFVPTIDERFGLDDFSSWSTGILNSPSAPWSISPVDLSFLNATEKPAGKRGFLRSINDSLEFDDGTAVRFWGTNLTANALFSTDKDNVMRQARRLSELGFNLVRFHHHDSSWVNPNIFGNEKSVQDTRNLSSEMLGKLDWWIKCLKEEGIYIWLDLHVGRTLKEGDQIQNFSEISKGKPGVDLRGYNYVNGSIREAMQRFNDAYLNHFNSHTGLRYKDDPAIVAMLLTNENDVTNHFGNLLLPVRNVPAHSTEYMARAAAFAQQNRLSKDKTWRAWEHGPSKLFLNHLEKEFSNEMIRHLRALGTKAPIVTTSTWGWNPLSSLPALTAGDVIAVHSYGRALELETNPLYSANLVHWMAAAQVVGRPLAIQEWNVEPFPVPDRHGIPLYVAGSGSLQGWDAVMQYAYAVQPLTSRGRPSNWAAFNDPGLISTLPAAALLYRRHDVREADTTYVFAPTPEQLFGQMISPQNSAALRTAAEKGKLMIALPRTRELPWLEPSRVPQSATILKDPNLPLLDAGAVEVRSDTGELRRNWRDGIFTVDTPRTQTATGWIGEKRIELADVAVSISTLNASVAVQSLDGNAIRRSSSLMISLGARAVPKAGGQTPFYSEPVIGELRIRAAAGLKLYKRNSVATEEEIPVIYKNGRYLINLARDLGTYWLFLK